MTDRIVPPGIVARFGRKRAAQLPQAEADGVGLALPLQHVLPLARDVDRARAEQECEADQARPAG